MASIPLPALDVRPVQTPDALSQYSKVLQMKSLLSEQQLQQQQIQQRQQELQSQQGLIKTIKDANGDPSKVTLETMVGNGVLPDHADAYLKAQLAQRQSIGALDANTRSTLQAIDEKSADVAQSVRNIKDPAKRQQAYTEGVGTLQSFISSQQALNPQMKQNALQSVAKLPPQAPSDDDLDTFIALHNHGANVTKQVSEEQAKAAETQANLGKAAAENAKAALDNLKLKGAQMSPADIHAAVQSVVPSNWADPTLARRTESRMNIARSNGDIEGIQKALSDASAEIGTVQKETNPQVQAGKVEVATATEVAKARALAPGLNEVLRKTSAGRQYISAEDATGTGGQVVRQEAAKAGIPVVNKDVASTLEDIDTAKKNQDYMLGLIGKKLASGAPTRLWYGPANTIEKIAQTDPEMASVGTFRNAAIQSMRAVAGSKGLRINQAEIEMAIDNDIPKLTDTLPVAQQKLTNLKTFLDNAESSHLTKDRSAPNAGQAPAKNDFFSQFGGKARNQNPQ
jgi:hypothetical protein